MISSVEYIWTVVEMLLGLDFTHCGGKVNFRATFPQEMCHKIMSSNQTLSHMSQ